MGLSTFSRNLKKRLIAGLITMSVKPKATLSESALSITAGPPCYCTAIRSFHSRAEWTVFELSQVVPACSYQAEVLLTAQVEKEGFHSFDPAPHPNRTQNWLHTCGLTCQPHSLAFCVQLLRLMHALKGTGLLRYESQNAITQPYVGWRAVILHPHPPPLCRMDWNQ